MAIWDRYEQASTGYEVKAYIGDIWNVRGYCDDPLGGVYVTKEPVCKLLVTPLSVFINTNFSWDISQSMVQQGTLDTYDIDFDGPTSGGDISAAAWAGAKTGVNQYTSPGHYTIVAYVTDTIPEKSKEVRIPIVAIDGASESSGGADDYESLQRLYVGITDSGCWLRTATTAFAAANTGLSGADLNFREMVINPLTRDLGNANHHLVAATKNGVAYTFDGAANWLTVSKATLGDPVNTAGDGTPPVTADLDQIRVFFDPRLSQRVYCVRTKSNRAWLYYSDDYLASWNNVQIGNGPGSSLPEFFFPATLEGWIVGPDFGSAIAHDSGDGNTALGCAKVTPDFLSPTYTGEMQITLPAVVVGLGSFSYAYRTTVAGTSHAARFEFHDADGLVTFDAFTPATTTTWNVRTGTFPLGIFTKLVLRLGITSPASAPDLKWDDIKLTVDSSWNVTHSAGGIPGSILVP